MSGGRSSAGARATDLDEIMRRFKIGQPAAPAPPPAAKSNTTTTPTQPIAPSASASPAASAPSSSSAVLTLEQILAHHAAQQSAAPSMGAAVPAVAAESPVALLPPVGEFLSQVNRQLSILLDGGSTAPIRRHAFEALSSLLRDDLPASHAVPAYRAALKPLLKRFGDEREGCRAAAIDLVHRAVRNMPDIVNTLHFIIPVLAYRMGTIDLSDAPITLGANTTMHERSTAADPKNVTPRVHMPPTLAVAAANAQVAPASSEQSPAVRTALVGILVELLVRCTSHELEVFLPDVCQMLYTSMQTDRAPETKLLVCEAIQRLCEDYPQSMRAFSRILMLPLMQRLLLDKSSSVRAAAVRAMGLVIPCGAAEQIRDLCAFRESNIIDIHGFFHGEANVHYFARLVADPNTRVRQEFFSVVNRWSLTLYERADYETLVMPYVFSGLSDTDADIRSAALETLRQAGVAYETEEKERLASGVGGTAQDEGAFRLKVQAEESTRGYLTRLPNSPLLFPPFVQRPPWGERHLARKFLDRLLHAVLQEKSDWKRDVAERSWTLLRVLLVYAEEHITQLCHSLLNAFYSDFLHLLEMREAPLEPMWHCIALVGRYTDPTILLATLGKDLAAAPFGERLRAVVRTAAHALEYVAYTHPAFEAALAGFERTLMRAEFLQCQEPALQLALLHLLASSLRSPVSSAFTMSAEHGGAKRFDTLHQVASATRWTMHAGSAWTKDQREEGRRWVDACYTSLVEHTLRSLGEEPTAPSGASSPSQLVLLFHLHLLPHTEAWVRATTPTPATAADLAEWTAGHRIVGQLVEVLERVGACGLFESGPPSPSPSPSQAAAEPPSTEQQISKNIETVLLSVLEQNAHLSTHAALACALVEPLRSASADSASASAAAAASSSDDAASSSTVASACPSSSFTPAFLSALRALLLSRRAHFRAAHPDLPAPPSSLVRLPRDQELKAEAAEKARVALRAMMTKYDQAVVECVQAIDNACKQ